jgi:hypothetical protein
MAWTGYTQLKYLGVAWGCATAHENGTTHLGPQVSEVGLQGLVYATVSYKEMPCSCILAGPAKGRMGGFERRRPIGCSPLLSTRHHFSRQNSLG